MTSLRSKKQLWLERQTNFEDKSSFIIKMLISELIYSALEKESNETEDK